MAGNLDSHLAMMASKQSNIPSGQPFFFQAGVAEALELMRSKIRQDLVTNKSNRSMARVPIANNPLSALTSGSTAQPKRHSLSDNSIHSLGNTSKIIDLTQNQDFDDDFNDSMDDLLDTIKIRKATINTSTSSVPTTRNTADKASTDVSKAAHKRLLPASSVPVKRHKTSSDITKVLRKKDVNILHNPTSSTISAISVEIDHNNENLMASTFVIPKSQSRKLRPVIQKAATVSSPMSFQNIDSPVARSSLDLTINELFSIQKDLTELYEQKVALLYKINENLLSKNLSENDKINKNSKISSKIEQNLNNKIKLKLNKCTALQKLIRLNFQKTSLPNILNKNELSNENNVVENVIHPSLASAEDLALNRAPEIPSSAQISKNGFSDDDFSDNDDYFSSIANNLIETNSKQTVENDNESTENSSSVNNPKINVLNGDEDHYNSQDAFDEIPDNEFDNVPSIFEKQHIPKSHSVAKHKYNGKDKQFDSTDYDPITAIDSSLNDDAEIVFRQPNDHNKNYEENLIDEDSMLLSTPIEERDEQPNTQDREFIACNDILFIDGDDEFIPSDISPKNNSKSNDGNSSDIDDMPLSDHKTALQKEIANLKSSNNSFDDEEIEESNIADLVSIPDGYESDLIENDSMDLFENGDVNFNDEREIVNILSDDDMDDQIEEIGASDFQSTHKPIEVIPKIEPMSQIALSKGATFEKEKIEDLYPWSSEVRQKLNDVFKLKSFRHNQHEAINATLRGKDVFVLMPTGGGKSLCYQLPAVVKSGKTQGTTIVISPLISLMQDQVQHLQIKNIKSAYINSRGTADERKHTFSLFNGGLLDLVYLSPEMISASNQTKNTIKRLYEKNQLARIVVDEAHCVSSWGHDFRPDYQYLKYFKDTYPDIPIMALTATANEHVRLDIIHNLKMNDPEFFKQSFNRTNLFYKLRPKTKYFVDEIKRMITSKYKNVTGIIYCHSKNSCEQISHLLCNSRVKAGYYHAGMTPEDRLQVQKSWQSNKIKVICATIAFGMGIDKPDVRYVIHATLPRTLEGYYQETGRAGRDGKDSDCILFYTYADARLLINLINRDKELDSASKEKHLNKFQQVVQYCENSTDCRRQQVLQYFNESFEKKDCNKKCDNCVTDNKNQKVVKDITEHTKNILKLVKSIQNENVTLIYCQDVYRGSKLKKIMNTGHDKLPLYGKGKDVHRNELQRIFFHLITLQYLIEYPIINKSGFANNYVKVSTAKYRAILNDNVKLSMEFSTNTSKKGSKSPFFNHNFD